MPKYKPTTIAYQDSGLIKDRQSFVTPNDAYTELVNAYVYRGITKRKLGYSLLGRLRRVLSAQTNDILGAGMTYTPPGTGSQTIAIFTVYGINVLEPNASLEPGNAGSNLVVTLDPGGANETIMTDATGTGVLVITGGGPIVSSATINYSTGIITAVFTAAPGALNVTLTLNYYPRLPVMGITQRELNAINAEDMICFDTRYAYQYSAGAGAFIELPSTTPTTWQGDDISFFWYMNYWFNASRDKYFWVTNGYTGGTVATTDPIRYYDGTTWNATAFYPQVKTGALPQASLISAKIIIAYRGRMVCLNTIEAANSTGGTATVQYPNRARWSQNGDPTDIVNGWIDDTQGFGGFVDAPTNEHIVSAAFIRDVLIVFFERSTWKLRYTGNEILPFVWERINIELGAESRFSPIKFDEGVLAVGDKGIVTCNGNNVNRIDEVIRDEVFKIHNGNNGVQRVHGIRNFFEQVVYWTFPAADTNPTYPNRVLLYNYDNKTWAFMQDSFTVFGTYQSSTDVRWSDLTNTTWEEYEQAWDAGRLQSAFPQIVAGNQQGYVEILNQKIRNDESIYIKSVATGPPTVFTSPAHNLEDGQIVEITGYLVSSGSDDDFLNNYRFQVINAATDTFQLQQKPRFNITAITNATQAVVTASGHNMQVGDLVQFANITGMTELNNRTIEVVAVNGTTFTLNINSSAFGVYAGGGTAENLFALMLDTAVSDGNTYIGEGQLRVVDNFSITSKKFNMLNQGRKTQLGYIDFFTDVTSGGLVDCPIYIDYNEGQRVNPRDGDSFYNSGFETYLNQFSTLNQDKEWHRMYCNVEASYFQYKITLDEGDINSQDQYSASYLISKDIQGSTFNLDGIIVWHETGGRLVR